jgi:hypothetical protein
VKLPYADQAVVPLRKITEYLLNEGHPQGRAKAAFFRRLGFRREQSDLLRRALLQLAQSSDMTETAFEFGRKYAGVGLLNAPNGQRVQVVTVWVLPANQPPPVLVTAYPA